MSHARTWAGWLAAVASALWLPGVADAGPVTTDTTLHTFPAGTQCAGAPILGADGALYGGATGPTHGSFFRLSPPPGGSGPWTYATLFDAPANYFVSPPLVFDAAGNIYGTAHAQTGAGDGQVFKLSPPGSGGAAWTYTIIYTAPRTTFLYQSITRAHGALYGVADQSGGPGTLITGGVVFQLTPPPAGQTTWRYAVLHSFPPAALPNIGLVAQDFAGRPTLFGSDGHLFALAAPQATGAAWSFTDLRVATKSYSAMIADRSHHLYGTEYNGSSDISLLFRLSPPAPGQSSWTRDILYQSVGYDRNSDRVDGPIAEDARSVLYAGPASSGKVLTITPRDQGGHLLPWNEAALDSSATASELQGPLAPTPREVDPVDVFGSTATSIHRLRIQPSP